MPPAGSDPPIPDFPSPKLSYTLVILSKAGNLLDMQTIFAANDHEAVILSKLIAGEKAFELWLEYRRITYFTGTTH